MRYKVYVIMETEDDIISSFEGTYSTIKEAVASMKKEFNRRLKEYGDTDGTITKTKRKYFYTDNFCDMEVGIVEEA